MPVMAINGTADALVDYADATAAVETWKTKNNCVGDMIETYKNGAATCNTYATCDAGVKVTFCTIEGLNHCWPGSTGITTCPLGSPTTDILANDAMWEFFQQFHK